MAKVRQMMVPACGMGGWEKSLWMNAIIIIITIIIIIVIITDGQISKRMQEEIGPIAIEGNRERSGMGPITIRGVESVQYRYFATATFSDRTPIRISNNTIKIPNNGSPCPTSFLVHRKSHRPQLQAQPLVLCLWHHFVGNTQTDTQSVCHTHGQQFSMIRKML